MKQLHRNEYLIICNLFLSNAQEDKFTFINSILVHYSINNTFNSIILSISFTLLNYSIFQLIYRSHLSFADPRVITLIFNV